MDIQTLFEHATVWSMCSIALPIACCIIKFKTLNNILRVLFLYLLLSACIDVASLILAKLKIPTYLVRHIFTFAEFTFITYFFIALFGKSRLKVPLQAIYICFLLLLVYVLGVQGRYNQPDNILSTTEAVCAILLSFTYFFKTIQDSPSKRPPLYYSWFVSAFLIYFSLTFAVFAFSKHIEAGKEADYNRIYLLPLVGSIIYNILIAFGLWRSKAK